VTQLNELRCSAVTSTLYCHTHMLGSDLVTVTVGTTVFTAVLGRYW